MRAKSISGVDTFSNKSLAFSTTPPMVRTRSDRSSYLRTAWGGKTLTFGFGFLGHMEHQVLPTPPVLASGTYARQHLIFRETILTTRPSWHMNCATTYTTYVTN